MLIYVENNESLYYYLQKVKRYVTVIYWKQALSKVGIFQTRKRRYKMYPG